MKLELGMPTLILSHIAFSIPFVIVSVRSNLSPLIITYEEAAQDLGANPLNTFFKVTLPAIMPGVISGATLSFTLSLDDVVISYFTAGPGSNTLPLKIYSMIKTGITPDVNALSTIMLLVTIIILTSSAIHQSRTIKEGARS
jgi:spermidine/putrescine transport system permease protein